MELDEAKTVEDCEEIATVDAYGAGEQAMSWMTCLEEVLAGVKKVKVGGEALAFEGLDVVGETVVVAVCKRGSKKVKATLDSIELLRPTPVQKLWLKAWLRWQERMS